MVVRRQELLLEAAPVERESALEELSPAEISLGLEKVRGRIWGQSRRGGVEKPGVRRLLRVRGRPGEYRRGLGTCG